MVVTVWWKDQSLGAYVTSWPHHRLTVGVILDMLSTVSELQFAHLYYKGVITISDVFSEVNRIKL